MPRLKRKTQSQKLSIDRQRKRSKNLTAEEPVQSNVDKSDDLSGNCSQLKQSAGANDCTTESAQDRKCYTEALKMTDGERHLEPQNQAKDIVITRVQSPINFSFKPIDMSWQACQANKLRLPVVQVHHFQSSLEVVQVPKTLLPILGDGNCFFRAISLLITGSENYHASLRYAVVQFMRTIPGILRQVLPSNETIMQYLERSNMICPSVWASEIEIYAMAILLKTDIYVYSYTERSWKWIKYSGVQLAPHLRNGTSELCIYLQHTNQNHFEVVQSTIDNNKQRSILYGNIQLQNELERQIKLDSQKKVKADLDVKKKAVMNRKTDNAYQSQLKSKCLNSKLSKEGALKTMEIIKNKMQDDNKKEVENNKAKIRKQLSRDRMSEEEKITIRQVDAIRKQKLRANLSKEDKDTLKLNDSERKRKLKANMSKEEKDTMKLNDSEKKQKLRANMSKEDKDTLKLNDSERKQKLRANMSKEDKDTLKLNDSERKRKLKANMSKEEKDTMKLNDSEKKQKLRANMSKEDKDTLKLNDSERKRKLKANMSKEEKDTMKLNDSEKKQKLRANMSKEDKDTLKLNDSERKQKLRANMSKEEKDTLKLNDSERKQKLRANLSKEEKDIAKDQATTRMKNIRYNRSVDIHYSISTFQKHIFESPEYICTVCHRLLYRTTVIKLSRNKTNYKETLEKCKTGIKSRDEVEYICKTCSSHIKDNKIPPQAVINGMALPDTPQMIKDLTPLEARLLSIRYPFMKLLALPRGRQTGIKGAVINVPVDCEQVCYTLPQTPTDAGIIPVKIKRKQSYKGHVFYQNIRPKLIQQCLKWLKTNNHHYYSIKENSNWEKQSADQNSELWTELTNDKEDRNDNSGLNIEPIEVEEGESDTDLDNEVSEPSKNSVLFDTCIQRTDPQCDAQNVISLAPGEGNSPINIMLDKGCEELSFPQLLPTGEFGFDAERDVHLTPKKYFNARILNKSGIFAKNIEYLFFAQYITEYKQIMDSISIAIRKVYSKSSDGDIVNVGMLRDPSRIQSLILKDKAYRFLQTIRGTPPYWQKAMHKLLAAVKQLGIFTFFVTFSAADLKWADTISVITKQQGKTLSEDEINKLSWEDKCEILRSNPVTAARHFDHRLQCLFRDVILSDAQPLGKVNHYSYRIEFQQRGSPHAHCVLWIDGAPQPDSDEKIIVNFIDRYVKCTLPSETEDNLLHTLVKSVQCHHHSRTCTKKSTTCRFNYPRLPSHETVIAKPPDFEDIVDIKSALESAAVLKGVVLDHLEEDNFSSLDDLLRSAKIPLDLYESALKISKRGRHIIYARKPSEVWTNTYNEHLLNAWQANLDVQYCLDPYACIAYMVAYITKDEREISQVLDAVSKETSSMDMRSSMKQCASAFLNAREVSAQEAVYRLLSFPLFNSNFETIFVPSDKPEKRVSLLKPLSLVRNLEDDDENVYQVSILDKYSARPDSLEELSLASFAVWYTYDYKQKSEDNIDFESNNNEDEPTQKKITLKNELGTMRKRKKPSILKYHKCSLEKEPEDYYYSQLLLYKPWRNETFDMNKYDSYQEHYENELDIITKNRSEFEHHSDMIEEALDKMATEGPPEYSFDKISPQTEQDKADEEVDGVEDNSEFAILQPSEEHNTTEKHILCNVKPATMAIELRPGFIRDSIFYSNIRSLNMQQREVFQIVMQWCNQISESNEQLQPLRLFVTGGAGTGKSFLIATLYQMAIRKLQSISGDPDSIYVLLTAPTGSAAHNISGITLHSAFSLPLGQTKSYIKLSDDKRNTLRSKLLSLKLLIIDEISMVGSQAFLQLHYRLTEITGSNEPFGGLSVLAFGDLFQLPPVGQSFVFQNCKDPISRMYGNLWHEFKLFELTEIMRQKDDFEFASMLNRIRSASYTSHDIELLKTRLIETENQNYPLNSLHVFAWTKDVNEHNQKMLSTLDQPKETFVAIDKRPPSVKDMQIDPKFSGGLPDEVTLAIGAWIMLTYNIDVADGLVNGAQGVVKMFIKRPDGQSVKTVAILIEFDNENSGRNARKATKFPVENKIFPKATPILRSEVSFCPIQKNKGLRASRIQFPIRLSWACTIHKVQGLTVDNIVVSFQRTFKDGQAYVALSRARTLHGLHLHHFSETKIKASKLVVSEMNRLRKDCVIEKVFSFIEDNHNDIHLYISMVNSRSLPLHEQDILQDPCHKHSDIIIATETWLSDMIISDTLLLSKDYNCFRADKPLNNNPRSAGGVAILVKKSLKSKVVNIYQHAYLQVAVVNIMLMDVSFNVVGIYNSPSDKNDKSKCNVVLGKLFQANPHLQENTVVAGDINENLIEDTPSSVNSFMTNKQFIQCVKTSTHTSGSIIDHLYTSHSLKVEETLAIPNYYSDHHSIFASFKIDDLK